MNVCKQLLAAGMLSAGLISAIPAALAQNSGKDELIDEMTIAFSSIAHKNHQDAAHTESFSKVGHCIALQVADAIPDSVYAKYDMHSEANTQFYLAPLLQNREQVKQAVHQRCEAPAREYMQLSGDKRDVGEALDYMLNTLYAGYEQADYEAQRAR